jgi:hypothetical protein
MNQVGNFLNKHGIDSGTYKCKMVERMVSCFVLTLGAGRQIISHLVAFGLQANQGQVEVE